MYIGFNSNQTTVHPNPQELVQLLKHVNGKQRGADQGTSHHQEGKGEGHGLVGGGGTCGDGAVDRCGSMTEPPLPSS